MQQIRDTVRALPTCQLAVVSMPFMADRLKRQREENHYSQQDVADFLGIRVQSYNAYERGKKEPNTERLIQLCKFLQCSADYLLGFVDEPYKHIEIKGLRPDQQKLLQWYEEGKLPRFIRRMIASGDLDVIEGDDDIPQIESGSETDIPGKQKAS